VEPPRAAEHQPALDAQVLPQPLDVGDQVPGRVVDQTGVRPALAAAALIEQHDPVALRIEEPAHLRVGAPARAAVQEHGGLAVGIAALLEVDLVQLRDAEKAGPVRLDRWVEAPADARSR
jgi:hypothetical protein